MTASSSSLPSDDLPIIVLSPIIPKPSISHPMKSHLIPRIPVSNRTRAAGMLMLLKALHIELHQRYLACVALYGRPLLREFAWSELDASTKRVIASLRVSVS